MILEIAVSALLAFVSVLVGGQLIMPILLQSNLVAQDINKKKRPMLPTSGGLILALGFFFGILALVFSANYIIGSDVNENLLLLTLISIVAISFVGFMDDISSNRIRTSKQSTLKMARDYVFFNGGIKQWQKPLFTLLGAIPLMVINFGSPIISVPLLGSITINQIVYALIVIPLAMVFSSNAFNMLEGLNGISVQMGLVAFVALSLFAYHIQSYTAFAVSLVFSGALLAYIYYGSYPAKILPGDSLTYIIGAAFAATVIIGNMQFLGLLLILPWLVEFILKARVRFHANSWGLIQNDGKLKSPHGKKIYSLTHLFLRTGRFSEWQIVSLLTVLEVVVASLSLLALW